MYIGPWQEYKLAKILNSGPEPSSRGSSLERTRLSNSTHNRCRLGSTPSTRSISSDVSAKSRFQGILQNNFREAQKLEGIFTKCVDQHDKSLRKPPVPPVKCQSFRRFDSQAAHKKRIERMRGLYGLGNTGKSGPELPNIQLTKREAVIEEPRSKEEVKLPPLFPKPTLERPPEKVYAPKRSPKRLLDSVHSSVAEAPHEEIEEDLDQQADGLLRWVEELPEEMSTSTNKLPIEL